VQQQSLKRAIERRQDDAKRILLLYSSLSVFVRTFFFHLIFLSCHFQRLSARVLELSVLHDSICSILYHLHFYSDFFPTFPRGFRSLIRGGRA